MSMEANLQETPDADLVAATHGGERGAYAALIHRHTGRVFAVCLGILGNVPEAEDIAQETFMRGLTEIKKLREGDRFAQWITQIARNLCRDDLKTRRRRRELLKENPVEFRRESEDFSDLYRAMEQLPEKDRMSIALYYLDGHTISSVAEVLGVNEGAAYTRLSRARRVLRAIMEKADSK
jgi:RNA polymerase sigma-70 factor (ECF subfamily)